MVTNKKILSRYKLAKLAFEREISYIRVGFVLLLLATIFGIFQLASVESAMAANKVGGFMSEKDSIISASVHAEKSTSPQIVKLKQQYDYIAKIKKSYFYIGRKYNSYGYGFALMFALSSTISAILGFLLVKNGWDNTTSYYLKSSFLVFFFSSTLFGVLPNVFGNEKNANQNYARYNYYCGLQLDIYNLMIKKNEPAFLKKPDTLNHFIYEINNSIKNNQDIYFDTDLDKIPKNTKVDIQ